jgi:hypothetical protein
MWGNTEVVQALLDALPAERAQQLGSAEDVVAAAEADRRRRVSEQQGAGEQARPGGFWGVGLWIRVRRVGEARAARGGQRPRQTAPPSRLVLRAALSGCAASCPAWYAPPLLQAGAAAAGASSAAGVPEPEEEPSQDLAGSFKKRGNEFFVAGDYSGAASLYSTALKHWTRCGRQAAGWLAGRLAGACAALRQMHAWPDLCTCPLTEPLHNPSPLPRRDPLLWANRAASYLKLEKWELALADAALARTIDVACVKVRRGRLPCSGPLPVSAPATPPQAAALF